MHLTFAAVGLRKSCSVQKHRAHTSKICFTTNTIFKNLGSFPTQYRNFL